MHARITPWRIAYCCARGLANVAWILAAFGLWALQPWARLVALIVAGFSLFEAVLAFFQFPGTGIGFSMSLMPILILLYLNSADVKAAFGEADSQV